MELLSDLFHSVGVGGVTLSSRIYNFYLLDFEKFSVKKKSKLMKINNIFLLKTEKAYEL